MQATILCYHKVGPALEEGRSLNIEPSRLESHVHFFSRKNHIFLRANELSTHWKANSICFTFDDAYVSTLTHAPSIFERHGVRATFFAVPGRVNQSSDWDNERARPLADWDLLRSAQKGGHEIGNHTFNHIKMAQHAVEVQREEVRSAHQRLVDEGLDIKSFCYPYGSHTQQSVEIIKEMRYCSAVILGKRIASTEDDPMALPRIAVAYSDSLPMLLYKLTLKQRLKSKRP